MNEKPPKPGASPTPDYDEKLVLAEMQKKPTGEWQIPAPVAHLLKTLMSKLEEAERKLRRRNRTRLLYGLAGLAGVGGGGYGTWDAHGKADDLSRRVHQLERANERLQEQLTEARIKIAGCCK